MPDRRTTNGRFASRRMERIAMRIGALAQLARINPVMSWGISAFLLGVGLSVHNVGFSLNYLHGVLALVMVVAAQGFVSHGLNDAYDWLTGTDRESIGKGTGGSRVIPEGKMSVAGVVFAALVALAVVMLIGAYFLRQYGLPMAVLFAIAIWSPVSYSVPPLKLGYRPFNEIVVVLPALVGVVVGTEMVLTDGVSVAAIGVGWLHAMFCISWFVVSRLPDFVPDKRVGKITSVVYVGRGNAKLLSAAYLALGLAAVPVLVIDVAVVFMATPVAWAMMMMQLSKLDPYDEEQASDVRLENMHITSAHAVGVALGLAVLGV